VKGKESEGKETAVGRGVEGKKQQWKSAMGWDGMGGDKARRW
jgi:hypothetical protein